MFEADRNFVILSNSSSGAYEFSQSTESFQRKTDICEKQRSGILHTALHFLSNTWTCKRHRTNPKHESADVLWSWSVVAWVLRAVWFLVAVHVAFQRDWLFVGDLISKVWGPNRNDNVLSGTIDRSAICASLTIGIDCGGHLLLGLRQHKTVWCTIAFWVLSLREPSRRSSLT